MFRDWAGLWPALSGPQRSRPASESHPFSIPMGFSLWDGSGCCLFLERCPRRSRITGRKVLTGFLRAHPLLCCWPTFPSNGIYVHDCSGHIWGFGVGVALELRSLGLACQQQVWRYTPAGLLPSFFLFGSWGRFPLDSWGCWEHFDPRSSGVDSTFQGALLQRSGLSA